jgi:hypothetical protein
MKRAILVFQSFEDRDQWLSENPTVTWRQFNRNPWAAAELTDEQYQAALTDPRITLEPEIQHFPTS